MKRERDPSGVEEDDDRGPGFIEPDCVVGELNQILQFIFRMKFTVCKNYAKFYVAI